MKISSKNSGKSGGAGIISHVKIVAATIFLVSIYDKSERETVTKKQQEEILKSSGLL